MCSPWNNDLYALNNDLYVFDVPARRPTMRINFESSRIE